MSDSRLDKMLPLLTPKERGIMTLRDFKAGKEQDRNLLRVAPDQQTNEINRYIGMMNAANGDLANVILVIRERVRQEELRLQWIEWARITALEMYAIRAALALSAREPITESAYRVREAEARAELIPIDECAMLYTEYHHAFDDADCETDEDGQVPTDAAWERVYDATLAGMRKAIATGTLKANGKGKRMKIECGSFHDWIGAPAAVPSDLGIEYDVRPDDEQRQVERERKAQAFIKRMLDRGACSLDLPLDMESPLNLEQDVTGFSEQMARRVAIQLRTGIQENWRELRAIEEKLDSLTEGFDGEDVLHPSVRERLDHATTMLADLHTEVEAYTGPFELPEPDEELRALVERLVEREMRNVPTR